MTSEKRSTKEYAVRYLVATLGMALAAFGPAFSIKSDLGTAPYPCPPYILHLWDTSWTVGEFTALENMAFIVAQLLILRKKFKPALLMQIPAIFIFSFFISYYLLSLFIFRSIPLSGFARRKAHRVCPSTDASVLADASESGLICYSSAGALSCLTFFPSYGRA